ncbi:hypothetical protein YC2023_073407 [Brassica napus]
MLFKYGFEWPSICQNITLNYPKLTANELFTHCYCSMVKSFLAASPEVANITKFFRSSFRGTCCRCSGCRV